jgi:hypothetical protein
MAANTTPIFVKQGNVGTARIAAANTASDGSGTLVNLVTSAVDGTRVDGVRFRNSQATPTTSSLMVHKIFLTDTSGNNPRIIGEVQTPAGGNRAAAGTVGATSIYTFDQPIIMLSGQIMKVCQSVFAGVQDQFDACAFAGDY